jgi:hypothetical protein
LPVYPNERLQLQVMYDLCTVFIGILEFKLFGLKYGQTKYGEYRGGRMTNALARRLILSGAGRDWADLAMRA